MSSGWEGSWNFIKVTRSAWHLPLASQTHTCPFLFCSVWLVGSLKDFSGSCASGAPVGMLNGKRQQELERNREGRVYASSSWVQPRSEAVLSGNSHLGLSCSSLWVMHSSFWLSQVQSFILLLFQFLYYLCNELPMFNFFYLSYLGWFLFSSGWIMRHTAGGIESRLKGCEGQAMGITEETVFQVEGRASTKALG